MIRLCQRGNSTGLFWVLLGLAPFAICVIIAYYQKTPRRLDGMNLG